ncbi:hypothetical protein FRACYDRAFT_249537 [Fragilariopsis cylindrus CCMP1102]|uniref:Uncharacterized protein n=1 Tax=Fragilariopsis cylindrus CCMP1102 TaxID=635003 RepID=A0A1E7ERR4_9STRA|nr:hypothetical protein FRACYDRAFT_249537 [Fragilariopsis cylindrus CCMP1102]|eukprot:OEU08641.1 hypothetical protein FRACYDRAFT_249537 [Fragilariopsis cylindrus CCMP1102]
MMDEIDDRQQQAKAAEQIAAAAKGRRQRVEAEHIAAAAAKGRRQRVEVIIVLEKHDEFHLRIRNIIDELVEQFVTITKKNDIDDRSMLYSSIYDLQQQAEALEQNAATVLECRRQRVELISTLKQHDEFPLRTRNKFDELVEEFLTEIEDDLFDMLSRLATEFGFFEKKARGGLLFEDTNGDNILQFLVRDIADDAYFNVMIQLRQLRQMGYFKKEDIKKYGLVVILCRCRHVIRKKIFRFLVEWDPTSLLQIYEYSGHLPLHVATKSTSTLQDFRMVFKYGIRYYPKKKGISLLFKKNDYSTTTFQRACKTFKYEAVMKVVEDILIRYSDTPINTTER